MKSKAPSQSSPWKRKATILATACALALVCGAAQDKPKALNLAGVAKVSASFTTGHEKLSAVNDGFTPANSEDREHEAYGNWPRSGTQWVEYDWAKPVVTNKVAVYWFDDYRGIRLPKAWRVKYWNGAEFVEVSNPSGYGIAKDKFNEVSFAEVKTSKLRLEMDSNGRSSTGILEWQVFDAGTSPNFAPEVTAGGDRYTVMPGKTYLDGTAKDDGKGGKALSIRWSKVAGSGNVVFADPARLVTSAKFSAPGKYVLKLSANDGELEGSATVNVSVVAAPPAQHLERIEAAPYKITSPLWRARTKALITNWVPYCARKIDDPKLREGGIDNFVQAGLKLAGKEHKGHVGAPFANAWVYNTLESMCVAQMVDAQGDKEILDAQAFLRTKMNEWIPKILSAQEKDGYIQTMYTLGDLPHWSNKADHEGYNLGYLIEAGLAHYELTGGKDLRLYNAARKAADCWVANLGPAPKKFWYEGHEEIEQALVRLSRFVNVKEGPGKGAKYVALAKFLLDSRKGGEEYDQSHLPMVKQYEAVGHSVRAVYCYSGVAGVAAETGDPDYNSAAMSLWNSVVNRKYYITGGVGSGETSEGFGGDFSLGNDAYSESCAGCGEIFFQHQLQLGYHDARFADLYEETLYNTVLGSTDLAGDNFTYTNALDSWGKRYKWHVCPCCVGNIPRTLLMLPTWQYSKAGSDLFVNLYLGTDVTLKNVAGKSVRLIQTTNYPWNGSVAIDVRPEAPTKFALRLRVPNRTTSELYSPKPAVSGLLSLKLNGKAIKPVIEKGYAVINRTWKAGDRVELSLPLEVQVVKADPRIVADRDKVALKYGPMVYNIEAVDQDVNSVIDLTAPLTTEFRPDLLGGVMVIKGKFTDGKPLLAIPNYARMNRGGRSLVWIKAK